MGIPGPVPQASRSRARDNGRTLLSANKLLARDGVVRGPDLPAGQEWPTATVEWWESWRVAPQAQLMSETDWHAMTDAARIHRMLQRDDLRPTELSNLTKEFHRILEGFGLRYVDRLKLRVAIEEEDDLKELVSDPEGFIAREIARRRITPP